jgi:hypothetical protein
METKVLEQQEVAVSKHVDFRLRSFADAIFRKRHWSLQQFGKMLRHGTKTVFVDTFAFGPAKV